MHRFGFKSINRRISLSYNYINNLLQLFYTHTVWAFLEYNTIDIIFRLLTAKYRIKPHFFVLGEQKCGTTTLCSHLLSLGCRAPFCPVTNPSHWLNKETQILMGELGPEYSTSYYYTMCFPFKILYIIRNIFVRNKQLYNLYFDGTADHLSMPWITKRIYDINPEAKLIMLVRNPIHRLYSNYKQNISNASWIPGGYEHMLRINNMNDYIDMSQKNQHLFDALCELDANTPLPSHTPIVSEYCIIQRSCYAKNIKRYLKYFKRENILILDFNELIEDKVFYDTMVKVVKFLGVRIDESMQNKIKALNANTKKDPTGATNTKLDSKWKSRDMKSVSARLKKIFDAENKALYELIGRDLEWDDV